MTLVTRLLILSEIYLIGMLLVGYYLYFNQDTYTMTQSTQIEGILYGVDTSNFLVGDVIYVSPTKGGMIKVDKDYYAHSEGYN